MRKLFEGRGLSGGGYVDGGGQRMEETVGTVHWHFAGLFEKLIMLKVYLRTLKATLV